MKAIGTVAKSAGPLGRQRHLRLTGVGAATICGAAEYGTPQTIMAGDGVVFDLGGRTLRVLATADDADGSLRDFGPCSSPFRDFGHQIGRCRGCGSATGAARRLLVDEAWSNHTILKDGRPLNQIPSLW
jgi:hypothetical protein